MYTATTENICVQVIPKYEELHSQPQRSHFVFSYKIVITNQSKNTVQLLKRHWIIKSADGIIRNIEGDGVIGQQPILEPGEFFNYSSWAPITSEIGEMSGQFIMVNTETNETFSVKVPNFQFVTNSILN